MFHFLAGDQWSPLRHPRHVKHQFEAALQRDEAAGHEQAYGEEHGDAGAEGGPDHQLGGQLLVVMLMVAYRTDY